MKQVEVANISKHGFWLLFDGKERFVPFKEFPWFQNATVGELLNVQLASPGHLHWPDIDVDLAVESIDFPERYPLASKQRALTELDAAWLKEADERIQLVQDLWDSIATDQNLLPLTPEQRTELDRCLDAYEASGRRTRPAEEVIAELKKKL